MAIRKAVFLLGLCSSLGGCVTGILYTDVTTPLTRNMNETLVSTTEGASSNTGFSDPFIGVSVQLDSFAIGDAAKNEKLSSVYYADLRRQSALLGLWQKNTVIVHGSK